MLYDQILRELDGEKESLLVTELIAMLFETVPLRLCLTLDVENSLWYFGR